MVRDKDQGLEANLIRQYQSLKSLTFQTLPLKEVAHDRSGKLFGSL